MVEGECIHIGIWFPKRPLRARKQLYGNQISRGMVEGECIHIGNLIPKTAISSQKEALRESNFKRYGRSSVYTEEIWFPKRTFRARKQLYGNQISRGMDEGECIHIGNLIPKTALLSQKAALRESNFKRYGWRILYTHRHCDSQNGPFEPERSFTGTKFQEVW